MLEPELRPVQQKVLRIQAVLPGTTIQPNAAGPLIWVPRTSGLLDLTHDDYPFAPENQRGWLFIAGSFRFIPDDQVGAGQSNWTNTSYTMLHSMDYAV